MTHIEIMAMLDETSLPYAYDHFAEGQSPQPPFLLFLCPSSRNFAADGRVYFKINEVHLELYTDRKDPDTELMLENVLDRYGVFYNKSEVWIESERLYDVLYSFETEDSANGQQGQLQPEKRTRRQAHQKQ